MPFKLSKDEKANRDSYVAEIRAAEEHLQETLATYNSEVSRRWGHVDAAIQRYNEALENARTWATNLGEEMQGEFDDKSEKWQEGDRGQEVQEWIDQYKDLQLDDVKLDEPDAVEVQVDDADTVGDLPDDV